MIPLLRKQFPNSKTELAAAMDEGLRQFITKNEPIVTVYARVFPYLDGIAINFDGGKIEARIPVLPQPVGETRPAVEAALVTVSGRHIRLQAAPINLQLEARDVVFHQGRDVDDQALLLIKSVRNGHLTLSASQLDLENVIRDVVTAEAKKKGIDIEQTRVMLRARGKRSLAAEIHLQARKFLFRAKIDLAGQVDVDDKFNARISNLKCRGEGTIGNVACSAIEPLMQQLNGKTFSLLSLPLGEIQMRDIRITVADTVEINAEFGSAA